MMISVDETALWTAIDALDEIMDSLSETMDGDEDEQNQYADYETARQEIMEQIKAAQAAHNE